MHTNENFKSFLGALGRYAEQLNKQLIESNDEGFTLSRKQGRLQGVTRIMTSIIEAPATLQAYKQPRT